VQNNLLSQKSHLNKLKSRAGAKQLLTIKVFFLKEKLFYIME